MSLGCPRSPQSWNVFVWLGAEMFTRETGAFTCGSGDAGHQEVGADGSRNAFSGDQL